MSFHAITADFQEQLDEFAKVKISEDVMDDVRLIISEYCFEIELRYGIEMGFNVWYDESADKLRYNLKPVSELDDALLRIVVKDESAIGAISHAVH